MPPETILNKLAQLRRRERVLRFIWGAARVVAVALVLLAFCCFVDWLIDRWEDTPILLRVLFFLGQFVVAAALTGLLIVLPMFKRLTDSDVAAWVERTFPDFRHRLITAVELNRPGAETAGMSPALIAIVTREAEQKTAATNFGQAIDSRRLLWSGAVLIPVLLFLLLPAICMPRTVGELLGRQFGMPLEITRSVRFAVHEITPLPEANMVGRDEPRLPHYDLTTPAVCASGDRVAIRFKAEGAVSKKTHGTVRIRPLDGPAEYVPLEWESETPDGKSIFVASVPSSSVTFKFKAWLGDARMRHLGTVEFEPRPTVESQEATVHLPEYCGLRSNGTRFEETQPKGDVLALSGSAATVAIQASKPLKKATIELLGPSQAGAPEQVLGVREMTIDESGKAASGRFDVDPRQTAYRLVVWDRFGFANRVLPRRGVALLPDEPPLVSLLPERFHDLTEDNEVDGLPVVFGEGIRIAYRAKSPAGLQSARLRYRINEATTFATLPLSEYLAAQDVGPFELNRGVFKNIREDDDKTQVDFHAMDAPSDQRDVVPPRREGGGRFDFQTGKIPELKLGDKIEFYVEVLDSRPEHLVGRSEARVKEVVSPLGLLAWFKAKRQESEKLRDLEKRQSGVFDRPPPGLPEKE